MIYLVELVAHDGVGLRTLYLSTSGYTSRPTDNPSNQYYSDRIKDAGLFARHLFAGGNGISGGTTRGRSEVGYGDIVVLNNKPYGYDELIDDWITWGFAGRPVVIKRIETETASLSSAVTLFTGTAEQIVSTDALSELTLRLHDRLADLDKPLLTTRYAGTTTTAGATAEGNADLKDQLKPKLFGNCANVVAVLVNPFNLLYQFSASQVASIVVYDGGVALTNVGDFATLTSLIAATTVVPGKYATCLAQGIVRLGANPAKAITADVVEGSTLALRSAAQIARRMLLGFGIPSSDLPMARFTALDADNAAECGIYVTGETAALEAVSAVLGSIGATIAPNRTGQFEVMRFEAPSGSAVATFDLDDNIDGPPERRATGDDGKGVPATQVTLRYGRIGVVQRDADLHGVVTAERRGYLASEFREVTVNDASVLTRFPNAPKLIFETAMVSLAAAQAEATRLLALYSAIRDLYVFDLPLSLADDADLGSVVTIISDAGRLGLEDGKLFVVIGRTDAHGSGAEAPRAELECWG